MWVVLPSPPSLREGGNEQKLNNFWVTHHTSGQAGTRAESAACLCCISSGGHLPPFPQAGAQPDRRDICTDRAKIWFSPLSISQSPAKEIMSWHASRFINEGHSWIRCLVTKGVSFPSSLHQLGQQTLPTVRVQAAAFTARSAVYRQIPVVIKATNFKWSRSGFSWGQKGCVQERNGVRRRVKLHLGMIWQSIPW